MLPTDLPKSGFIQRIMRTNNPRRINDTGFKEIVTKLLDDGHSILNFLTNTAFDLVLRSLAIANNGDQVHKTKSVKNNLPITLNINMDCDQHPLTVTGKMTTEQVFGMMSFVKYNIKHGDIYIDRFDSDSNFNIIHHKLLDYDIKHCDIITMTPRLLAAVQLPMYDRSSGGIQVLARPAWSSTSMQIIVQNDTTIATFKQMIFAHDMVISHIMEDETRQLENLSLVFRARQLENLDERPWRTTFALPQIMMSASVAWSACRSRTSPSSSSS